MKSRKWLRSITAMIILLIPLLAWGQNSLPAPGTGGGVGGNSAPAPGNGPMMGGPVMGAPMWGNPWNNAWNSPIPPGMPAVGNPGWQNSGNLSVIGCGYDAQGVWRVVPMTASYTYNGVQYDVTIINAWNPWLRQWDYGVDVPAVNTYYFLRGNYYNFYVVLSTGTFYFNL